MNNNTPLPGRSLQAYLFRPLEIAVVAAAVLLVIKISVFAAHVAWWLIAAVILVVPVLFALLFCAVYALSWFFSFPKEY